MITDKFSVEIKGDKFNVDRFFNGNPAIFHFEPHTDEACYKPVSTPFVIANHIKEGGSVILARETPKASSGCALIELNGRHFEIAEYLVGKPEIIDKSTYNEYEIKMIESHLKSGGVMIFAHAE